MKIVQFMIGRAGGAERFFIKLSEAFRDQGFEQHLIVNAGEQLTVEAEATGIPMTVLPVARWPDIKGWLVLRRVLRREKPDVVVVWMNCAARRLPRGPYLAVGRLGGWYPVRYYRSCHYLIGNTPGVYQHILKDGWPAARAAMISNFGELPDEPPLDRALLDVPGDAFLIMALGRLDYTKGFDVLIEVMTQLPPHTYLCIAGTGPVEAELKDQVARLGLQSRVRLLGWRTDQAALLKAADLCVFPSREEPLGNVTLEAWSVGLPVVTTRCEGQAWLVEDEVTGLIAEPGDPATLGAAIGRMISDPVLRARLASAGKAKWQKNFSRAVITGQYMDFFKQALAAPRS